MKKNLLWIAVAALTVGFASCNKDADNFTETFSVKVDADNMCDDLTDVYNAYYDAAGIAKDGSTMSIDIQGNDYDDCVGKFTSLLKKAEAEFSSRTQWDEAVSVVAQDSKYTEVYRKEFGANSKNEELQYSLFAFDGKNDVVPKAGEYVKDLYVDTYGSPFDDTAERISKTYAQSKDLNWYAGGRYVYMSEETTTNQNDAVTGAFILKSTTGVCKREITYNGVKYQCSSELDNVAIPNYRNRDLNEEASGPWLFLYTTHDTATGKRLLSGIYVCSKFGLFESYSSTMDEYLSKNYKLAVVGDELEFMPGSYAVSTESDLNNIKLEHRDGPQERNLNYGQDMNEGAGGRYMYLLLQWETIK